MMFHAGAVLADEPVLSLSQIREARDRGEFVLAAEQLLQLHSGSDADFSIDCVLLARAGQGALTPEVLVRIYDAALEGIGRQELSEAALERRLLVRLAAGNDSVQRQDLIRAARIVRVGLTEIHDVRAAYADPRVESTIQFGLQVAYALLANGEASGAGSLYHSVGLILSSQIESGKNSEGLQDQLALSQLGLGWSLAMQPDRHEDATRELIRFVELFPAHQDAPQAAGYAIRCQAKAGNSEATCKIAKEFLSKWPHDGLAPQVATTWIEHSNEADEELVHWLNSGGKESKERRDAEASFLFKYAEAVSGDNFDLLVNRMIAGDTKGQRTAQLLETLGESGRVLLAKNVVAKVLAVETNRPAIVAEAACRWAARNSHWYLLSEPSGELGIGDLADDTKWTTVAVRLLAESLMQTGKAAKARPLWDHLVDDRGKNDFPTLLRCAETVVAHGTIAEAQERLDQLREQLPSAANGPPEPADSNDEILAESRKHWVDLIEADLAIRSIDFDRARTLFESVVRSPSASTTIQGRAQWMIGESYLMQKKYSEAINAYRLVEGIDPVVHLLLLRWFRLGNRSNNWGGHKTREFVTERLLVGLRIVDTPPKLANVSLHCPPRGLRNTPRAMLSNDSVPWRQSWKSGGHGGEKAI